MIGRVVRAIGSIPIPAILAGRLADQALIRRLRSSVDAGLLRELTFKAEIDRLWKLVEAAEVEVDHVRADAEPLARMLADAEAALAEEIELRDAYHEAADGLAYHIAPPEVIGEHSNLNDPWHNALEALDAERQQHQLSLDAAKRSDVRSSAASRRTRLPRPSPTRFCAVADSGPI